MTDLATLENTLTGLTAMFAICTSALFCLVGELFHRVRKLEDKLKDKNST